MPLSVFIAFAIFSLSGGLRHAWIGKEKVDLLSLGLTTLAEGGRALKNPTPHRRSLFGPMKVCRS